MVVLVHSPSRVLLEHKEVEINQVRSSLNLTHVDLATAQLAVTTMAFSGEKQSRVISRRLTDKNESIVTTEQFLLIPLTVEVFEKLTEGNRLGYLPLKPDDVHLHEMPLD